MTFSALISEQMQFVSFAGPFIWLGFFLFLLVCTLLYIRHMHKELFYVFLSLLSYFYVLTLKVIFHLQRPSTATLSKLARDRFSFPSSHTVTYTVIFGFLLYLFSKYKLVGPLIRLSLRITFLYLILLVGISRVYLGQHYARDVIFGYIFGLVYLLGLIYLYKKSKQSVTKDK